MEILTPASLVNFRFMIFQRPAPRTKDLEAFIESLISDSHYKNQVRARVVEMAREPSFAEPKPALPGELMDSLRASSMEKLYSHQVECLQAARAGKSVVLCTPTASGKTLAFALPVLETALKNRDQVAMLLYPTNALANDQVLALKGLCQPLGLSVASYTGQTREEERNRIAKELPNILITNPEMLNASFLPWAKSRWAALIPRLRFLILDELHAYRGTFGAHMAWLLFRLRRLVESKNLPAPQVLAATATVGDPSVHFRNLWGEEPVVVRASGGSSGTRHLLVWEPPLVTIGPGGKVVRRSAVNEAGSLLASCLDAGLQTLVFVRSRAQAEILVKQFEERRPRFQGLVAVYRAGYLSSQREILEEGIKSGRLRGVVSTSALEMGVDIGGLDVVLVCGFPGSVASFRQQVGRAGRRGSPSAAFFIPTADPLDMHFSRQPDLLFGAAVEKPAFNRLATEIAEAHLNAAAVEKPLSREELLGCGSPLPPLPATPNIQKDGYAGLALGTDGRYVYSGKGSPAHKISLRSADAEPFMIQDGRKLLEELDGVRVHREAYPGAVYLHQGAGYRVIKLDEKRRKVSVEKEKDPVYTRPQGSYTVIPDGNPLKESKTPGLGAGFEKGLVRVRVTDTVSSYKEFRADMDDPLRTVPIDPPLTRHRRSWAAYVRFPGAFSRKFAKAPSWFSMAEGLHAVEHLMASLAPLRVQAEPGEVESYSAGDYDPFKGPAVFLIDGVPGAGLAEGIYESLEDLLLDAEGTVSHCRCESGCPSCVLRARCHQALVGVSKGSAELILKALKPKSKKNPPQRR